MKIWDLEQARFGGYYPSNIDSKSKELAIRYAGFNTRKLLGLEKGENVSSITREELLRNKKSDDLGHVIPVMLQGSATNEKNFFRQHPSMNKSLGNSEEKEIRKIILAKKYENAELGLIWIFNKPEWNDDNNPLIRPQSILLLAQFTFKGPNVMQKKTVMYYFFNPTHQEYNLAKQMLAMIHRGQTTPSFFKYSIENLTQSIQKVINDMVDFINNCSNVEALKMARKVLNSLKDEEHEWDAEIIKEIYAKVGLKLEKRGIIKEIIATGYALGHYLAFLYATIFNKTQLDQLDGEMCEKMQKIYTNFTSGDIIRLPKLIAGMDIGGSVEKGSPFDNTTETLGFLLEKLELGSDSNSDFDSDSDSD